MSFDFQRILQVGGELSLQQPCGSRLGSSAPAEFQKAEIRPFLALLPPCILTKAGIPALLHFSHYQELPVKAKTLGRMRPPEILRKKLDFFV